MLVRTRTKEEARPGDKLGTGLEGAQSVTSTSADTRIARREPWYGDRELRYLKDYLDGLVDYSMARAPTPREAGFRAWLKDGTDNWLTETLTGAMTLELPARNGKRPDHVQLPLVEENGASNL